MPATKATIAEVVALREQGLTVPQIAERVGLDERGIFRKLAKAKAQGQFPRPPVPEGFDVTKVTHVTNKDGAVEKAFIQSKPATDSEVFEPIATHFIKGESALVNADGEIIQKWIKTDTVREQQWSAMKAAVEALTASVMPLPPIPMSLPTNFKSCLLNLYTITDAHVGALAWARETGEPWDLTIAERVLTETICRMIHSAPDAEVGVVNQLGDFLHFDSLTAETPTSGHILDSDSRYQKMVEVAVRILETVIHAAAQKHATVRVYMHEGNHDMAGSVWLRVLFARLFRDNPRVVVEDTPNPYPALQWGKNMVGFHHGHLSKFESLPLKFAEQHARMWGDTEFRVIHTGHLHHTHVKEFNGITVHQHPTLAAKDAHSARHAYASIRKVTAITYHRELGEVGTMTFLPSE